MLKHFLIASFKITAFQNTYVRILMQEIDAWSFVLSRKSGGSQGASRTSEWKYLNEIAPGMIPSDKPTFFTAKATSELTTHLNSFR